MSPSVRIASERRKCVVLLLTALFASAPSAVSACSACVAVHPAQEQRALYWAQRAKQHAADDTAAASIETLLDLRRIITG